MMKFKVLIRSPKDQIDLDTLMHEVTNNNFEYCHGRRYKFKYFQIVIISYKKGRN